jgi:hypothetical protein
VEHYHEVIVVVLSFVIWNLPNRGSLLIRQDNECGGGGGGDVWSTRADGGIVFWGGEGGIGIGISVGLYMSTLILAFNYIIFPIIHFKPAQFPYPAL